MSASRLLAILIAATTAFILATWTARPHARTDHAQPKPDPRALAMVDALHTAIEQHDAQRALELLGQGVDPAAKHPETNRTAAEVAAVHGETAVLEAILNAGAATPSAHLLGLAARHGKLGAAQLLASRGAELPLIGPDRGPLIREVAAYGYNDVLAWMLASGADPNAANREGWTPMHAAAGKSAESVRLLAAAGGGIEAEAHNGFRPLHVAAEHGALDALLALIELGASLDAKTAAGKTAYEVAIGKGRLDAAVLLQEHLDMASPSAPALSDVQWEFLARYNWPARTGDALAIWVSVPEQLTRVIRGREILFEQPCATAKNGVGAEMDSLKTPPGWHSIRTKIGEGAPWGQVFRSKQPVAEIWQPGQTTTEDLVLTRVIVLDGEEPGVNKGGRVDSFDRFIYFHGTNGEAEIGTPSSHGCIRLTNDAVIAFFDLVNEGAFVLITPDAPGG